MIVIALLTALLLTLEGAALYRIVTRQSDHVLALVCGYPLGVLLNALVFFVVNLIGLSISSSAVYVVHGILLIVLLVLAWKISLSTKHSALSTHSKCPLWLIILCSIFLLATLYSGPYFGTALPSYYWDAFTNWAMRAKISFAAGAFVTEGVIQPQYPIGMHALYMVYMLSGGWNDVFVGVSTALLSCTGFAALFLLLKRSYGSATALLVVTLTTSIPLAMMHLRQGYADIHIALFALLAAVLLDQFMRNGERSSLTLSTLFVACACWLKWEGVYFVLMPWLVVLGLYVMYQRDQLRKVVSCWLLVVGLIAPWSVYVIASGLPLSPHGRSFAINLSAVDTYVDSLFVRGTFGMYWWVMLVMLIAFGFSERRTIKKLPSQYPMLACGLISFIMITGVYLLTQDVKGLIQGDNFSRVMLLPTMLLTQALVVWGASVWKKQR